MASRKRPVRNDRNRRCESTVARLSLEGDFSNAFNVYAPTGYDSDLRYILPPDFMAFLVDHANMFDIEFIDNEVYLYGVNFFSLTDPNSIEKLFGYAYDFQQAIHHHLVPYVDWRVGNYQAKTISVAGKQLSKALPRYLASFIIVVVILLAYYLLRQ